MLQAIDGGQIKTLREAMEEHVGSTLDRFYGKIPQERIALELGICLHTLIRYRKKLRPGLKGRMRESGEELLRDRR